jgi:NADH-quinone oxidoreductase subunit C
MPDVAAARERVITAVLPELASAFPGAVAELPLTQDGIPQVSVGPAGVAKVARWLKEHGFNMLVDIGGVDYYPKRTPRFEVVYHFRELPGWGVLRVRCVCGEKDEVPTLSHLWEMADPAEREIWDQFGIKFKDHPNLTRILNPDDWEGHPLRRDYPLRGPRALVQLQLEPASEHNLYWPFTDEEKKENG